MIQRDRQIYRCHPQLSACLAVGETLLGRQEPCAARPLYAIHGSNLSLDLPEQGGRGGFARAGNELKRDHARRGWEFYTGTHTWHPDGDLNMDGLQVVVQIYAEQTQLKGPVPKAAKYVDQSFLRDALKELGGR